LIGIGSGRPRFRIEFIVGIDREFSGKIKGGIK